MESWECEMWKHSKGKTNARKFLFKIHSVTVFKMTSFIWNNDLRKQRLLNFRIFCFSCFNFNFLSIYQHWRNVHVANKFNGFSKYL